MVLLGVILITCRGWLCRKLGRCRSPYLVRCTFRGCRRRLAKSLPDAIGSSDDLRDARPGIVKIVEIKPFRRRPNGIARPQLAQGSEFQVLGDTWTQKRREIRVLGQAVEGRQIGGGRCLGVSRFDAARWCRNVGVSRRRL